MYCVQHRAQHYSRLDSTKAIKSRVKEHFEKIFGDLENISTTSRAQFVCDKCMSKVHNAVKLDVTRKELREKFLMTRDEHRTENDTLPVSTIQPGSKSKPLSSSSNVRNDATDPVCVGSSPPSTPHKSPSVRPKRPGVFSPGTPSSKVSSILCIPFLSIIILIKY